MDSIEYRHLDAKRSQLQSELRCLEQKAFTLAQRSREEKELMRGFRATFTQIKNQLQVRTKQVPQSSRQLLEQHYSSRSALGQLRAVKSKLQATHQRLSTLENLHAECLTMMLLGQKKNLKIGGLISGVEKRQVGRTEKKVQEEFEDLLSSRVEENDSLSCPDPQKIRSEADIREFLQTDICLQTKYLMSQQSFEREPESRSNGGPLEAELEKRTSDCPAHRAADLNMLVAQVRRIEACEELGKPGVRIYYRSPSGIDFKLSVLGSQNGSVSVSIMTEAVHQRRVLRIEANEIRRALISGGVKLGVLRIEERKLENLLQQN